MLCPHCDAQIDQGYKYCPNCGANLESSTTTSTNITEPSPNDPIQSNKEVPVIKKKHMPFWFKLLATLAVIALIGVTAGILFTESLVDVVDNQLSALRGDDLTKAYYAYTSTDFQKTTSLDQFRNFLNTYPIFVQNQSAHFTQRSIENNIGTLKGNLTSSDHTKVPVEYKLIKEDDKWKILSVRLLHEQSGKENNESIPDTAHLQEIADTVKSQLQTIEKGDIKTAYRDYASQEFKAATSEKDFQDFVKRYPILMHHSSVSLHKPTIKNDIGTISAILNSGQVAAYIKYYLVYENSAWKVGSMRILSPTEEVEETNAAATPSSNTVHFSDIKLGTKIDEQGVILNPTTHLHTQSDKIYVNFKIANGIPGETIHLNLTHVESQVSIVAKAKIEENGDSMLISVFTPPETGGWPEGRYQLVISSSSGLSKIVTFEIE